MKLTFVIAGSLLLATASAPAGLAAESSPPEPRQETAELLKAHEVRATPDAGGRLLGSVSARRPITGARTVLPVLGETVDERGRSAWIRVRLPGRTIGTKAPPREGWTRASGTLRSATPWHLVIRRGSRRVIVFRDGRRVRSYAAIVGRRATPTPAGEYFVEENVRLSAGQVGAPFALATSARSSVLQTFEGGPGQIAVHGLRNVGGHLGSAVSHGCVRVANDAVTWLAGHLGPGVPISIY